MYHDESLNHRKLDTQSISAVIFNFKGHRSHMRKVAFEIRKEIKSIQHTSYDMADLRTNETFSCDKLKMLITLICIRNPSFIDIAEPDETISQLIVMHTKTDTR